MTKQQQQHKAMVKQELKLLQLGRTLKGVAPTLCPLHFCSWAEMKEAEHVYLWETYLLTPAHPAQVHAARAALQVSQQPRGWRQGARGRG